MGLFGNIISSVGKTVQKAGENFITAVAHPVSYVSNTFKDVTTGGNRAATQVNNFVSSPLKTQVVDIVKSTGTVAAAVVAGGTTAGRAAVVKVAKAVYKAPVKTLGTATGAVVLGSAALSSPKTAKAIVSAPSSLSNFGTNVGKAIENPSMSSVSNIVKENPLISAAVVAGAGVLTAKAATAVANIVTTERNTSAVEKLTNDKNKMVSIMPVQPIQTETIPVNPIVVQQPFNTPAPVNSPSQASGKKKKKKSKKKKKKSKKKVKKKTIKRRKPLKKKRKKR